MLFAVVLCSATSIHCSAMLGAMLLSALMRVIGVFAASIAGASRMMRAVGAMLSRIGAMFGASRIFAVWMSGAMRFTVVLANSFVFTMFDASLVLFTLGFFAVLHAIMVDGV